MALGFIELDEEEEVVPAIQAVAPDSFGFQELPEATGLTVKQEEIPQPTLGTESFQLQELPPEDDTDEPTLTEKHTTEFLKMVTGTALHLTGLAEAGATITPENLGASLKATVKGIPGGAIKAAGAGLDYLDQTLDFIALGFGDYSAYEKRETALGTAAETVTETGEELTELPDELKELSPFNPLRAMVGGAESFGYMLPALATHPIAGVPGVLGTMAITVGGQEARRMREEEGYSKPAALSLGSLYGLAEVVGEKTPMKILYGKWGDKWVKELGQFALREVGQESITESLQYALDVLATDETLDLETFTNRFGQMLVQLPFTLGLTAGTVKLGQKVGDKLGLTLDAKIKKELGRLQEEYAAEDEIKQRVKPGIVPEGEEIVRTEKEMGFVGPTLEGVYTPVPSEYFEVQERINAINERFRELAKQYPPQSVHKPLAVQRDNFKMPLPASGRRSIVQNAGYSDDHAQAKLNLGREKGRTIDFKADPTRNFFHYFQTDEELITNELYLMTAEEIDIDEYIRDEDGKIDRPATRKMIRKRAAERIPAIRAAQAQTIKALKPWINRFVPKGTRVILGDGSPINAFNQRGSEWAGEWGRTYQLGAKTYVIDINFPTFIEGYEVGWVMPEKMALTRQQLLNTAAHELGHDLVRMMLHNAPLHVQEAVYGEYERYLMDVGRADMSATDFIKVWRSPIHQQKELPRAQGRTVQQFVDGWSDSSSYVQNFDEYAAERIATSIQQKAPLKKQTVAEGFWAKVAEAFEALYNDWVKPAQTAETIDMFVEQAAGQKELSTIREQAAQSLSVADAEVQREFAVNTKKAIAAAVKEATGAPPVPPTEGVEDSEDGMPSDKKIKETVDTYNKGVRIGLTLTQLAKLNPHIQKLQQYVEQVRQWFNTKNAWTLRADETLKQWQQLSAKEAELLSQFLLERTTQSDTLERKLTTDEFLELAEKFKLTDDMVTLVDQIETDMLASLEAMERLALRKVEETYADNPVALEAQKQRVLTEYEELKNRDYFPLSRFGEYTVTVRADKATQIDGKQIKAGEVFHFETFETSKEAKKAWKEIKKKWGKHYTVATGKVTEDNMSFNGMPPQLVRMVKQVLGEDPTAVSQFDQLLYKISPSRSFAKNLLNRKGTAGFSMDAMRGYAMYFSRFSGHIARVEHAEQMQDTVDSIREDAQQIQNEGGDSTKRTQIQEHLARHYEYIMNPGNEFANLRAIGFIFYLGFSVKSAAVNLTQVPLVAYPHLAAQFGDAAAVAELTKAMKGTYQMFRHPEILEPELQEALSRLTVDGIIDQSAATELAAVSEGSTLQRYVAGTVLGSAKGASAVRQSSFYAAYLFQTAEKVNRRIVAIAAFRLARKQGMSPNAAYLKARDAVESTQYEYAIWNRAEFMRGKKSVVFLFWQYMQNTAFFAFGGDPGWWRFMLMMLVLGGLSGLPFAEDLMNLANFALRKWGHLAGWNNPTADVRTHMKGFVKDLNVNPDLIMHGLSRNTFAIPQLTAAKDPAAWQGFDLSGSLSMGRLIPGTEGLATYGATQDFQQAFQSISTDWGGAFISIPLSLMQASADNHPDGFKRWERALPIAVRNAAKAYRYAQQEGDVSRTGAVPVKFDVNNTMHRAELIGQSMGFTPTRLSMEKDIRWNQKQAAQYWETRRRLIMQNYDWSVAHGDKDSVKAARKAWMKFNSQVPKIIGGITGKDMVRSRKARVKARAKEEARLPKQRRYGQLYEEIRELNE